jgi:hypothetical protein
MRARRLLHETPSGSSWPPGLEQRRVNVDFPVWMIESLDREARRLGVTRQSIIKVWIAERLERRDPAAA